MLEGVFTRARIDRALTAAKIRKFGISFLDDALRGIFPNDLFLVCAKTGSGKTHFASQLALSVARNGGQVLFYALEADQYEIQNRLIYHRMSQRYYANFRGKFPWPRYVEWLAGDYDRDIEKWEKEVEKEIHIESLGLTVRYFDENFSAKQFIAELQSHSIQDQDLIIVDHLHYFDYGNESEIAALREAIRAIRTTALKVGKPVVLLAQLRKEQMMQNNKVIPYLDDIHGHSDIAKVATAVIMIAPAEESNGLDGMWPTYFHIAKSRKAAECRKYVATLTFEEGTGKYNDQYILGQYRKSDPPTPITNPDRVPRWARRAIRNYIGTVAITRKEEAILGERALPTE